MGTHIPRNSRRTKVKEYDEQARRSRASFKQYLRDLEEELLEDELSSPDLEDLDPEEKSQWMST